MLFSSARASAGQLKNEGSTILTRWSRSVVIGNHHVDKTAAPRLDNPEARRKGWKGADLHARITVMSQPGEYLLDDEERLPSLADAHPQARLHVAAVLHDRRKVKPFIRA